jgi:hypothetical protein
MSRSYTSPLRIQRRVVGLPFTFYSRVTTICRQADERTSTHGEVNLNAPKNVHNHRYLGTARTQEHMFPVPKIMRLIQEDYSERSNWMVFLALEFYQLFLFSWAQYLVSILHRRIHCTKILIRHK